MKKIICLAFAAATLAAAVSCQQGSVKLPGNSAGSYAQLESEFSDPPRSARPFVWWHWMNGNITKDGIRKDLLWMDRIGIGGFHHFDAGIGVAPIVENRMVYMHDDWKDAFRYAIALGDSLGMEMTVASSPGWSCMGGPWVAPEDAMKKLVWKELLLEGGTSYDGPLPEPFTSAGKYGNMRHGGRYDASEDFYRDIAVLAVKVPEYETPLAGMDAVVTSSGGNFNLQQLANDDLTDGELLPETAAGFAWIQYTFSEPQSFRAVSLFDGRERNWPNNTMPSYSVSLQKSDDGIEFTDVVKIPDTHCQHTTVSFPEARAKYFRLKVDNTNRRGSRISEFKLYTTGRINHAEEKAAFGAPHDLHDYPTVTDGEFAGQVIDITDKFADGNLRWDAPEGKWKILRIGYSLTGHKNGPAPEEATGLEVDKLDPAAWSRYFHRYLDMYKEATGGMIGSRGIRNILTDSFEAGCQNWTPDMISAFREHRGYDLVPWLPVLTGEIVSSIEESEAFLWDWNVTIAELHAENYDRIDDYIKEYGMEGRYSESHECGRVYVADGMDIKRRSTVPMAACWVDAGPIIMAATDIRESASVAHIYGQNLVAAESMTAYGFEFNDHKYSPSSLKATVDWEFGAGVNRIVVHESAHQPLDSVFPGLGLGPYGQWFNRHETWAEEAKAWTDYLARTSYMLQQGRNVADFLIYYGEDSNPCAQYGTEHPKVPAGFNYDYANPAVLKDLAKVKNGKVVAGNMEYKVLYLGKNVTRVTVPIMQKLSELAKNGAVICGHAPGGPASMTDDPKEWNKLLSELQSYPNVHLDVPIEKAAEVCGLTPDVDFAGEQKILFVHRTLPGAEIYWINRREQDYRTLSFSFRQTGRKPRIWHPETGLIEDASYRMKDGRTEVDINFVPDDAIFVVFGEKTAEAEFSVPERTSRTLCEVEGPWKVRFQEGRGAPESAEFENLVSFTESSDFGIRYFSGEAVYTNSFTLDKAPEAQVMLNLGTVRELAEVKVNDITCGTVWKEPFNIDISNAVKEGENTLEIKVANVWRNRLIGDLQPECEKPITYVTHNAFTKETPLTPAGLIGPVKVSEVE